MNPLFFASCPELFTILVMIKPLGLDRDRLSVLSGALVLALTIGRIVETPVRPFAATVLGSPLGINLSAATLILAVLAGLAATAVESLVRSHPLARAGQLGRSFHFWIVPALLLVAEYGWLAGIEDLGTWAVAIVAAAVVIPLALVAEYSAVDPEQRGEALAGWGEMAVIYLTAVLLYSRIYDLQARALLSGTAVVVVTILLVTRLFWYAADTPKTAALYGLAVGMMTGLFAWTLNYLPLSTASGGLLLLLFFYVLTGLIQQFLSGRFGRRVVLEYGGVGLLGLVLILLLVN